MKNKRLLKGLILIGIIAITFTIGGYTKQNKDIVKVENILYTSTEDFKLDEGEIGIEFNNGSWGIINESKQEYIFQPQELGDWNYNFDNIEDFKNCIETYLNIANNGGC